MDLFKDEDDYFGFNEDEISRGAWDVNCNATYGSDLFSSIKSYSEHISLEHNVMYEIQCHKMYYNACYGYSTAPFSVRYETMGYKEIVVHPREDSLEGSQKEMINHLIPRHMTPKMPRSVMSQHVYSNISLDEVHVNVI